MPVVGGVPGAGAAWGSCAISMGEPAGTKRAGSAAAPLVVASFTGIPLSRSEPGASVDEEAFFVAFVPA